MKVLGIEVGGALIAQWREWYAPEVQPFFVDTTRGLPKSLDCEFTPETRDTFRAWSPNHRGKKVVWLDETNALEQRLWPTTVTDDDVIAFVEREGLINQRPHPLTGFAAGSGPNCFGAVMDAAGVAGAHDEWMQPEPFTDWLHANARKGGADDAPGTVLVWRDTSSGDPFHAALTLGDGWAFEKSSQCWWSPRYVTTVAEVKRATRMRGIRLERWRLTKRSG